MTTHKGKWYIVKHVSGIKVGIIGMINGQFVVSKFMPLTVELSNYVNEWYYQLAIECFDKLAHSTPKLLAHNLRFDKFLIIKADIIDLPFTPNELEWFVSSKYKEHILLRRGH